MVYTDTTDLMCQCVYPDQSQPNPPAASPPASSPPSSGSTKSNSKFEGAVIVPDQEGERLLILDPTQAWTNNPPILWEYKATGAVARLFNSKWSDAKVEHINGKDYILFCGSGSKAVAMVSVDTKQVVFAKTVGQSPHSIAMLPDGNILVVDTGGGSKEGRLFVFDSRTGRELDNVATNKYTHGAVWVTPKNRLYSAPGGQIWKYSNGKLTLERSGAWDSECNHDVMPGMTQDEIICTGGSSSKNNKGVHSFNTKTGKAAPVVAPVGGAKGADIRRSDGQVIYVLQSRDSRDDTVRFKDATDRGNKDFLFYKAHFYQRNIMLPELTVSGFPGSASSTKFITEEAEAGEQLELSGSDRRAWAGSFWFLFAPLLVYIH
jgi:DNA-binding beta-propeller fold protein YncE